MATEAVRLECKESTGRKEKTEREKHTRLIPAFSWKALEGVASQQVLRKFSLCVLLLASSSRVLADIPKAAGSFEAVFKARPSSATETVPVLQDSSGSRCTT